MKSFWRIIGVLAGLWLLGAILSPVFQGNHLGMRRGSCMSNMKQLGLALFQYTQDGDGTLPPLTSSKGAGWRETLYPYVKSSNCYRCPDDPSNPSDNPNHLPYSYGANAGVMTGKAMTQPTPSIMLTDMRGYDGPEWNMTSPAFLPSTRRKLYAHIQRHEFYEHPVGKINCLFADGHVKALKPMDTLTPSNFWTRDNAPFAGQDLANAQAILRHAEEE